MIGGGLLGLEAARGLLEQGLEVHVVHLMPHLMEVQLDPPPGRCWAGRCAGWASASTSRRARTAILGEERVDGPPVQGRLDARRATWS